MSDRITYSCENGHRVQLALDGPVAEAARERRRKTKTCEIGVGDGRVCGARLESRPG